MTIESDQRFFCAVKGAIVLDGEVLLVRRTSQARGDADWWEFPGGRMEFGETPPQAICREVAEETRLCVKPLKVLSVWTFQKTEDTQVVGITYLCAAESGNVKLSHEHDDFAWVTPNELSNYKVFPALLEDSKTWDWQVLFKLINKTN